MRKTLLIIPTIIAVAIFFYPTISNSNSTGSPGGKTGSPVDVGNCMGCHTDALQGQGAEITTDIPLTGYTPGNTYTITAMLNLGVGSGDPKGFEVTCEENATNTKAGLFGASDPTNTQLKNNGTAVTHTTAGNSMNTWNFNWVAPIAGTGDITFYGAFIEADYPMGNQGDLFNEATLSINESVVNSTINLLKENDFTFNSVSKTIEVIDNSDLSVFSLEGKLVLSSNKKHTNLSHLPNGTYIIKSDNNSQKIFIH
jgi:hypothetical protein